jgi:hypothetical protein
MLQLLTEKQSPILLTLVIGVTCFLIMLFHDDFREMVFDWISRKVKGNASVRRVANNMDQEHKETPKNYGSTIHTTGNPAFWSAPKNSTAGLNWSDYAHSAFETYKRNKAILRRIRLKTGFSPSINPLGDTAAFMRKKNVERFYYGTHRDLTGMGSSNYEGVWNTTYQFRHRKGGRRG